MLYPQLMRFYADRAASLQKKRQRPYKAGGSRAPSRDVSSSSAAIIERSSARSTMKIVRAQPEDAEALTEIAHAAKRHWEYPESWITAWRDVLTMRPEFLAANTAYIASEEDRPVGFYVLTTEDNGIHLDHLWILPAAMRRGIGRALFEHAVRQARNLRF